MTISFFFRDTKPFGRLVGLFLIFMACSFISIPLGMIGRLFPDMGEAGAIRLELVATALAQLVTFLLSAWLFAKLFCEKPSQAMGLRCQGRYWLLGLVAVAIILLLVPVIDWITAWNDSWTFGPLEESFRKTADTLKDMTNRMLSLSSPGDLLLQIVVVALVPAVCEELFFRAILQPTLQSWVRNGHVGILLAAVIFSLAHGDLYGFLPRFVLGVVLGYLFWFTGSTVVNAMAHFVNNLSIVILYHLYNTGRVGISPTEPFGFGWELIVPCTLGAILLFYIYFVKNEKIEPSDPISVTPE